MRVASLRLTSKQRDVLVAIVQHFEEHGCSPTFRELKDSCGLASLNGVSRYVQELTARGYLLPADGQKARNLRVAGARMTLAIDDSEAGDRLREALKR